MAVAKDLILQPLANLVGNRFVSRDSATRRPWFGIRLFDLGSAAVHERRLQGSAHVVFEQGCHLGILRRLETADCVAAPVQDQSGIFLAALSVAGPRQRLKDERLAELAAQAGSLAAHLSANLRRQAVPAAAVAAV